MSNPAASMPAPRQTVFKRQRRSNFTVLGNAVLFDTRLELEECAAIVKLLAKPHDWQIHPVALRREWKVGKTKFYRIINKLIRLGYVTRGEMLKDSYQRFVACEYIVTDEPEAPPAEIDLADDDFEPAEDESAAGEGSEAAAPEPEADAKGVASVPHAGFGDAAEPDAENGYSQKELREGLTNPPYPPDASGQPPGDDPNSEIDETETAGSSEIVAPPDHNASLPPPHHRELPMVPRGPSSGSSSAPPPAEVPVFEKFVAAYKPEPHMSFTGAHRRWLKLTDQQRIDAVKFLPEFCADRAKRGWKMPDMRRYLMDQHWVPYAKLAKQKAAIVLIARGSPQWCRWLAYYEATNPQRAKWFRTRDIWSSDSEWPPPLPPKEHRANSTDQHHGENHGT